MSVACLRDALLSVLYLLQVPIYATWKNAITQNYFFFYVLEQSYGKITHYKMYRLM